MPRPLKIWNGRGDYRKLDGHLYVCASTKKEAVKLITQAGFSSRMSMNEFNTYWLPCWGRPMDGITPERGVWFIPKGEEYNKNFVPRRLI